MKCNEEQRQKQDQRKYQEIIFCFAENSKWNIIRKWQQFKTQIEKKYIRTYVGTCIIYIRKISLFPRARTMWNFFSSYHIFVHIDANALNRKSGKCLETVNNKQQKYFYIVQPSSLHSTCFFTYPFSSFTLGWTIVSFKRFHHIWNVCSCTTISTSFICCFLWIYSENMPVFMQVTHTQRHIIW